MAKQCGDGRAGIVSGTKWITLACAAGWYGVAACILLSGCEALPDRFSRPGTIDQQRMRATIHDPYPDPDAGPELDGNRPRDYAAPLPEAVRNRVFVDSWWGR